MFHPRRIVVLMLLLIASIAKSASAHPMGNFSINQHTRIRVEAEKLRIRYRIDLAEIPTYQEMPAIDTDGDGKISDSEAAAYAARKATELSPALHLAINGKPTHLDRVGSRATVRPGAGGLPTLLITIDYTADWKPTSGGTAVSFVDENYAGRNGWREIVVDIADGTTLRDSTASASDVTNGLEHYPVDSLTAPPQQSSARFIIDAVGASSRARENTLTPSPSKSVPVANVRPKDRLASLIQGDEATVGVLTISLVIAFALGCGHALAPGHGKTVVGAYLVGSRGTIGHAILLGAVVTVTHTIGVFALGLAVLFASRYVVPEAIYPWLGFVSGMMIASIGGWQLVRRLSPVNVVGHVHAPGGHSHEMPDRITLASLLTLGISGGIVPCPSALVLLLAAVALHRVGTGLILILGFSLGLATVLIAVGLSLLYARRAMESWKVNWPLARFVPIVSSAAISILGVAVALGALSAAGINWRPY